MSTRKTLIVVLAAYAAIALGGAEAEAGPPLLSDDPETPGDGRWEVNVDSRTTWTSRLRRVEGPNLDVNYGLGERWQLKFEIPFVFEHAKDEGSTSGIGAATFGAKWRFFDQGDRGFSMSVYPQLEVGSLAAFRHVGEERGPSLLLPFQAQYTCDPWKFGGDGGRSLGGGADGWFGGIWASRKVSDCLELLGELHAEWPDRGDDSLFLDVGAKWRLGAHTSLLVSGGFDLLSTADEGHAATAYVGLRFTF